MFDKILEKIANILELPNSGFKKYSKNTIWLFIENILRMLLSLFVGIYVARYLRPEGYGLLSYSNSFVGLFVAISTLGLDNILTRELVKDKNKRDILLGSAFVLKIIGAILLFIIVYFGVRLTNNDNFTNLLIYIIAFSVVFRSFDVIKFYFQSEVLSKYIVHCQIFAQIVISVIKIILILSNASLIYFVIVILIDEIILAIGFVFVYEKRGLSILKWNVNFDLIKNLLKDSWPLMFSGIAISLYMRIDQVMIKNMLDAEAVGYYAVAVRISEACYFIPVAITNSLFPAIINAKNISEELYYKRLQKLYNLVVWVAIVIAFCISLCSKFMIKILFGNDYLYSANIIIFYVWVGIFISIGLVNSKFLLIQNYTKLELKFTLLGAFINIILNYFFIKYIGILGAALSTIISYVIINYVILFFDQRTEQIFKMISKSFTWG